MKLIQLQVMTNKYDGSIKNMNDLEDSFKCFNRIRTIYLNTDQILYKTDIMVCKEYYHPEEILGKYFLVHCTNGEKFYLRENQFDKI